MTIVSLVQPIDTGHYCLPEEAEVHFNPTSKKVEQEFLSFLKHGMWKIPSDSLLEEDKNQLTDIGWCPCAPLSSDWIMQYFM